MNVTGVRTRSENMNMKTANIRSVVGHKVLSFHGPDFWNGLDTDTRQLENKNGFKEHISKLVCRDVNLPG